MGDTYYNNLKKKKEKNKNEIGGFAKSLYSPTFYKRKACESLQYGFLRSKSGLLFSGISFKCEKHSPSAPFRNLIDNLSIEVNSWTCNYLNLQKLLIINIYLLLYEFLLQKQTLGSSFSSCTLGFRRVQFAIIHGT